MKSNLEKVIVLSGASSDLGLVITRDLLRLGHSIVAHYSSNVNALKELASPRLLPVQADLTDDQQVQTLMNTAKKQFGRVDILINMIGPFAEMDIVNETPSAWRRTIELNLNVVFATCHFFQDELIRTQGHILNFGYAGIETVSAWPEATSYAAAKAGLAVLTKSLGNALAPRGVRVNAVCPGWIDSGHFTAAKREKIISQIPAGRIGTPDEVAAVVRWILLESPSYLTSTLIPIGGGIEF